MNTPLSPTYLQNTTDLYPIFVERSTQNEPIYRRRKENFDKFLLVLERPFFPQNFN